MDATKTVKLEDLSWDEVSGVDHGAHKTDGWMVVKSAGVDLDARIEKALEEIGQADLPDAVREAATTLAEYVTGVDKADEREETIVSEKDDEITATEETEVAKTEEATEASTESTETTEATAAAEEKVEKDEKVEEEVKVEKTEQAVVEETPSEEAKAAAEEIEKAISTLPEPVAKALEEFRKAAEAANTRAQEAERIAKAERDLRLDGEYVEKVKGFTKHLTIDPAAFGPRLRKLAEGDSDMAAEVERILTSANAIVSEHNVLGEVGKSMSTTAVSAWEKVQAAARERVSKGSEKTEAEAIEAFLNTPDGKTLYQEYQKEVTR